MAEVESMDESGDRIDTTIDYLPPEVLVLIFKKAGVENYSNIAKVCRFWQAIIDKSIGVAVRIGGPKQNISLGFGLAGLVNPAKATKSVFENAEAQKLAEFGISMCKFDEVRNTVIPPFKYPHLLKILKIRRYFSLKNFIRIMNQTLFQLEKLSISQATLTALEVSTVDMKNMTNLKKIEVTGQKRRHRFFDRSDSGRFEAPLLITNFVCLLNKDFPGLQCLKAQIPAVYHKDIKVMLAILNFLARHKRSLKRLSITYDEYYDLQPAQRSRPRRNQVVVDPIDEQKQFDFGKVQVNSILEKLCFNFNQHATNHMSILVDGIRDMIKGHTALKSLELSQAIPVSPELNNLELPATLTNLRLDVKRGGTIVQQFDLDLSILQNCDSLRKLMLVTSMGRANIFGGTNLPKSLEQITINQFKMTNADCTHIITELPKLQEMTFRNIGRTAELGFKQQDLIDQLSARPFKKVHIMQGILKSPVPLVIPADNPVATELYRLMLSSPEYFKVVWKADQGKYVEMNTEQFYAEMDELEEMAEMGEDLDFEDEEDNGGEDEGLGGGNGPGAVLFMGAAGGAGAAGGNADEDENMEE